MEITEHEARVIVFWLGLLSGKWKGGSYQDIEDVFNRLAVFGNVEKKWKWRE